MSQLLLRTGGAGETQPAAGFPRYAFCHFVAFTWETMITICLHYKLLWGLNSHACDLLTPVPATPVACPLLIFLPSAEQGIASGWSLWGSSGKWASLSGCWLKKKPYFRSAQLQHLLYREHSCMQFVFDGKKLLICMFCLPIWHLPCARQSSRLYNPRRKANGCKKPL